MSSQPLPIEAAATTPDRLTLEGRAVLSFAAAQDGEAPKRPTFTIAAYTGSPMVVEGFYSPVIVDLGGMVAGKEKIPILLDHDPGQIVGQTDSIAITAEGVALTGTITGEDAHAATVTTHAKNGFEWGASIGASIVRQEFLKAGEKTQVNGREVAGPLVIARESRLYETSFVAIGADSRASANVAASTSLGLQKGAATVFETWLQAKGIDPANLDDAVRSTLQSAHDAEVRATTAAPPAAGTPDEAPAQGLTDIFARQRAENTRIEEITRITAQALAERPGMAETLERMARTAVESRPPMSSRDYELEVLRATRAQPGGRFAIHTPGDTRATARTIEAALCLAGGLEGIEKRFDERTLNAASDRFKNGLGLCDVLLIAARDHGYTGHSAKDVDGLLRAAFPADIRATGWSTISLPGIFSNTANKFLWAGFSAVEDTWKSIAARRSVPDFKAITTYTLTGGMMYEKVGPGGELKHGTLGEQSYTNRVETYGRMFAITRSDIINDDLGALTQIPRKLGRGAALSLNDTFWTAFMNNVAFFTTLRANYFEGAATNLQISSLTTAETMFLNQTDPDGYPVAVTPRILLVPNALSVTASNLMTSTMVASDTTANTLTLSNNPHQGKYQVVTSSYLSNANYTGNSTTAWYLLADPQDIPVIEVAFLNGKEVPTVENAEADFNVLGIQFRGYLDYGVGLQEYRAGVKSKGAV